MVLRAVSFSVFVVGLALATGLSPSSAATFQSDGKGSRFTIDLHGEGNRHLQAGRRAHVKLQVEADYSRHTPAAHRPSLWISPRLSEQVAREVLCRDKVKRFASGRLADRAEIDLTSYLLVTLNDDSTIGFINPHVALNRTKLESLIVLPAQGLDWAQDQDGTRIAVTLPDAHSVAVIDTETRKIARLIDTGSPSHPTRILRDTNGTRMWVGLDGSASVLAIDVRTGHIEATLPVGNGRHNLAQSTDGLYLFVSNSVDGTVSLIDTTGMKVIATIPTGHTPLAVAWSQAAHRLFVAHVNEDVITVVDPTIHRVTSRIEVPRGATVIRFDPNGTVGMLLRPHLNSLSVLDAPAQRLLTTGQALPGSDDVLFSHSYAYVRSTGSDKLRLYDLAGLRRGELNATEVQAGQSPPAQARMEPGVADMLAPIPGGGGVILANPADRQLYFYHEGMMAMSGSFQTYSRAPRGLLVLDRGLRRTASGSYEATVQFEHGGLYDLVVSLNQPGQADCFSLKVEGPISPRRERPIMTQVQIVDLPTHPTAGQSTNITVRLTNPHTNKATPDVEDLQFLMVELPGTWQHKTYARPKGGGVYEAALTFPRPGRFTLAMSSASLDMPFTKSPIHMIQVRAAEEKEQASLLSRGH